MKYVVLFLCLNIFVTRYTYAQLSPTYYLGSNGGIVKASEAYYMVKHDRVNGYYKSFYVNQSFKDKSSNAYYQAPAVHSEGVMLDGERKGIWKFWYPNGQKMKDAIFYPIYDPTLEDAFEKEEKIVNLWDTLGNQMVSNGSGEVDFYHPLEKVRITGTYKDGWPQGTRKAFYPNGTLCYEETYEDGNLRKGTFFTAEGKEFYYTSPKKIPQPLLGLEGWYRQLGEEIKYPKKARRHGIQGKVFVQFVVNEEGRIENLKVIKGISEECNAETLRAIETISGWKPGEIKGQVTPMSMTLPVTFRLF